MYQSILTHYARYCNVFNGDSYLKSHLSSVNILFRKEQCLLNLASLKNWAVICLITKIIIWARCWTGKTRERKLVHKDVQTRWSTPNFIDENLTLSNTEITEVGTKRSARLFHIWVLIWLITVHIYEHTFFSTWQRERGCLWARDIIWARATFRSYGNKFCYECHLGMMYDAHFEMTVID